MKRIFLPLFCFSAFALSAQDGTIDQTFGTSGRVSNSLNPLTVGSTPQKIIVLSSGKILQAFSVDDNFGVARYNNNNTATLDNTFGVVSGTGGTGIVTLDFGGADGAMSMIVQSDGKIILAGYSGNDFAVARLNPDGTPDLLFGTDGKVTSSFGAGTVSQAFSVDLQNNGRIVVAGFSVATGVSFAVARYTTTGNLDSDFDGDGLVTTSFNLANNDQAKAVIVQDDDKIVVAGYSAAAVGSVFSLVRYNANGSLDGGFSGDGKVTTSIGSDAGANAVTIQPDGKIIAAGYGGSDTNSDFALVRYNANGTLDNTFNSTGTVLTPIGSEADIIYSVSLQNDLKILVCGSAANALDNDFAIARYSTSGIPDGNFGTGGSTVIDFGGSGDVGYSFGSQGVNLIIGGIVGTSLGLTRIVNSVYILPLYLYSFTATKQNNSVVLNWQTNNEQYTFTFEVQRSNNGSSFVSIATVNAAGNSTTSKNYSATDLAPIQGLNYYRLKMIDIDGKFTFSKVITARFTSSVITLQAFPNPVKKILNLQFNAPAGKVQVRLADALGRTLKNIEIQSLGSTTYTSLDMTDLPKGIYLIYLNGESIKIIKEE